MRQHGILAAPQIRRARIQRLDKGIAEPLPGLEGYVSRSWDRSLAAGLSPIGRISCHDNLSGPELHHLRDRNQDLLGHAQPVMDFLFAQLHDTQSMVILSDGQGVLMHTLGDLHFLHRAERVALMCGASWHETQRGTNAIGTALAEGKDVEIHGAEHFLERNGFLTCAAAPIVAPQGQLLGVLDISGDHRAHNSHALGLASTAARMIENSLAMAPSRDQAVLQFHRHWHGVGSIGQGILRFTREGWLAGANRAGLALLRLGTRPSAPVAWSELFAQPWAQVVGDDAMLHLVGPGGEALLGKMSVPAAWTTRGRNASVGASAVLEAQDTGRQRSPSPEPAVPDSRWLSAMARGQSMHAKAIPLLVQGESGVGKDVFARALHATSTRRAKPFVAINCAALPEHLIEAELFGYAPGAFTGASRRGAAGRLREAQGGTLFLDEIGDMPLALQSRLLRVLQDRQVTPLGGGAPVAVEFALVCATHHPLEQAMAEGRFREDLFYRINGMTVQLPALREREDFDALVAQMLQEVGSGGAVPPLDPMVRTALAAYAWPGNLRQLHNALRAAAALFECDAQADRIDWRHLPPDLLKALRQGAASTGASAPFAPVPAADAAPPPQNLRELSRRAIQAALENARGNVSAAARQLGISRQTLYRRLQQPH